MGDRLETERNIEIIKGLHLLCYNGGILTVLKRWYIYCAIMAVYLLYCNGSILTLL